MHAHADTAATHFTGTIFDSTLTLLCGRDAKGHSCTLHAEISVQKPNQDMMMGSTPAMHIAHSSRVSNHWSMLNYTRAIVRLSCNVEE